MTDRPPGSSNTRLWYIVVPYVIVFGFLWFSGFWIIALIWVGLGAAVLVSLGGWNRRSAAEEAPPATQAEPEESVHIEEIAAAFTADRVEPHPVSLVYWIGLLIVALGMVFLLVAYVAIIALVIWGIMEFAAYFPSAVEHGLGLFTGFIYFSILFAGLALLFFMIKPLFIDIAAPGAPVLLGDDEQPRLRLLIKKLSYALRAPMPGRIAVDCNVNASVGYTHGMLGEDLTLTIGLPLVEGMNLSSLAGIISHELAHFSQGTGMRLSYVISKINLWFHRVIFERDAWDAMLVGGSVALFPILTSVFVWMTRRILHLLMMLGHLISTFLLRQMEYQADAFEARIIGPKRFGETNDRMRILSQSWFDSHGILKGFWDRNLRVADSFPEFIVAQAETYDAESIEAIRKAMYRTETGLFDTHPSDLERQQRVNGLGVTGIFHLDIPAEQIFDNYHELAARATRSHYKNEIGLDLEKENVVPTKTLFDEHTARMVPYNAVFRFFGAFPFVQESFTIEEKELDSAGMSLAELKEKAADARKKVVENKDILSGKYSEIMRVDARLMQVLQGETLEKAGIYVGPEFHAVPGMDDLPVEREVLEARMVRQIQELVPYHKEMKDSLLLSLRVALDTTESAGMENGERVRALVRTFKSLKDHSHLYGSLRSEQMCLGILMHVSQEGEPDLPQFAGVMKSQQDEVNSFVEKLQAGLSGVPFPFDDDNVATASDYLRIDITEETEEKEGPEVATNSQKVLSSFSDLYYRVLGHLILCFEETQKQSVPPATPAP